jgi:hypothetical protein
MEVGYASWVQAVGEGAESRLPAGREEVELLRTWMKGRAWRTFLAIYRVPSISRNEGSNACC